MTVDPEEKLFQVLMREAFWIGWPCPIHNIEAIANDSYYVVGKIILISIIQGGQPPVCCATPVADFLVFNAVKCSPSLKDISDINLHQILLKVSCTMASYIQAMLLYIAIQVLEVKSTEELRQLLQKGRLQFSL